jgi:hypothetical protein
MEAIISIFRMSELSIATRIKIIKRLGTAMNYQFAANVTEPLVYELVLALDPNNPIKDDPHYSLFMKEPANEH